MKSTTKWLAAGLLSLAGAVGTTIPVHAQTDKPADTTADKPKAEAKPTQDVLIFRNGTVKYGKIVSETSTLVVFKGSAAGIEYETDFPKADILDIKRNVEVKDSAAAKAEPEGTVARKDTKAEATPDDGVTRSKYYWVELKGDLGGEISQTPVRKALIDARDNNAETIIFHLDATFTDPRGREKNDFEGDFDKLGRATAINQVMVNEAPVIFEGRKFPRIVFWVKRAMGGAAYLPLVSKEVYFHPDGKLGGIGNLDIMMKGHERVVEKQISLRLQRAAGWANVGGYPELLVRGLALRRTVLSVRYADGKPILFEGYPKEAGEELLSDSGEDNETDTIDALARGEGDDALTLDAATAKRIGFSKGTAETNDELLYLLGLERAGLLVKGRSEQITKDWARGLDNAMVQITKTFEELADIRIEGDRTQRNRLRSTQIAKLERLKSLLNQWGEGLDMYWMYQNRIPLTEDGDPDIAAISAQQEAIRIEIMRDR
jgi:hypothetical protein